VTNLEAIGLLAAWVLLGFVGVFVVVRLFK
jgi:hypothetical protein